MKTTPKEKMIINLMEEVINILSTWLSWLIRRWADQKNLWSIRGVSTMKKGLCIELTQGQYDHLYNIMCSQDEIVEYLNESDDFDVQTFDNLFDNICAAKETYLSNTVKGV